jgi:hypothetical protein
MKWVGVLIGCGLFVAAGYLLMPTQPLVAWASIIFFGCGISLAIASLVTQANRLHLNSAGFQEYTLFRSRAQQLWDEVEFFGTYKIRVKPTTISRVGFVLRPGATLGGKLGGKLGGTSFGHAWSQRNLGVDGDLADNYGRSADDLVELLTMWLLEHRSFTDTRDNPLS